jgi:hypothetical protein
MPKIDSFSLYEQIKRIGSNIKVCCITASEVYYKEHFPELKKERRMFYTKTYPIR